MNTLFNQPLKVVNVGLQSFASNIQKVGGEVIALSWQPRLGISGQIVSCQL